MLSPEPPGGVLPWWPNAQARNLDHDRVDLLLTVADDRIAIDLVAVEVNGRHNARWDDRPAGLGADLGSSGDTIPNSRTIIEYAVPKTPRGCVALVAQRPSAEP